MKNTRTLTLTSTALGKFIRLPEGTTYVLVPADVLTREGTPQARPAVVRKETKHVTVRTPVAHANDAAAVVRAVRAAVAYVGRYPLTHAKVKALESPRDREVYKLVRQRPTQGATRAALLKALKTTRTGIVDGALRRLFVAGLLQKHAAA